MRMRRSCFVISLSLLTVSTICLWTNNILFVDPIGSFRRQSYTLSILTNNLETEKQITRASLQSVTGVSKLSIRSTSYDSDQERNVSSECPGLLPPQNIKDEQKWLAIEKENKMFVFSAYFDEIDGKPYIRLIGLKQDGFQLIFCHLWFSTTWSKQFYLKIIMGSSSLIANGYSKRYIGVYYLCPLPNNSVPHAVSIVTTKCQNPLNSLPVQPRKQYVQIIRNFTVCVSPLNMNYSRAYEIVEWLELNRMLGADYFVIYNYSSAYNIRKVLKLYSDRGLVEVVQWPLPMIVDTWPPSNKNPEVTYFGQMAALNDCLYRSRPNTKFLVNIDIDEFIIPRGERSYKWVDMLKQLPEASAYIFRNTFFRKDWPNYLGAGNKSLVSASNVNDVDRYILVTLKKLQRESVILPDGQRSKYIVKANDAVSIRVHDVVQYRKGLNSHVVDPSVGFLHHYRNWFKPDEGARVLDTRMLIYQDELVHQIRSIWSKLEGVPLDLLTVDKQI